MRRSRRGPFPSRGSGLALCGAILLGAIVPLPLMAQESVENLPEIPLTLRLPVAARYAGMGGVSIAVADDHAACLSNPATLGLVRGIEFAAGFSHQVGDRDVTYLGETGSTGFGKTRLADLGFAYPFPTYRGRFVIGFQYGRVGGLDSDYMKEGSSDQVILEREGIFEEGGLGAYAISAAIQVSPGVTLGATGTILSGSSFRERTFDHETAGGFTSVYQTTDADISGVTGTLGALVELNRGVRLGLMIQLPEDLDFDGVFYEEVSGEDPDEISFTDEIDLPFRIGSGLAFARRNLILAADAIYTDWTQISFAGPLRTVEREFAYRETFDLRIGAEYLLGIPTPIRLRAGYTLQPLAYRLILTDVDNRTYEEARFDRDRHYLTFGAGILLGQTITLDVAYMDGGYERSAPLPTNERYVEEEKDRRVVASFTLRLN